MEFAFNHLLAEIDDSFSGAQMLLPEKEFLYLRLDLRAASSKEKRWRR